MKNLFRNTSTQDIIGGIGILILLLSAGVKYVPILGPSYAWSAFGVFIIAISCFLNKQYFFGMLMLFFAAGIIYLGMVVLPAYSYDGNWNKILLGLSLPPKFSYKWDSFWHKVRTNFLTVGVFVLGAVLVTIGLFSQMVSLIAVGIFICGYPPIFHWKRNQWVGTIFLIAGLILALFVFLR
jgi:hypothetical protein